MLECEGPASCQEITGQWIRMFQLSDQKSKGERERILESSWGQQKTIPGDPRATRIEVLTITLTVLCTVTDASMGLKSYFSPELTMQPGKILRYPFFCATFSVLALHFSPESWGERDMWHLWFVGTKCDKERDAEMSSQQTWDTSTQHQASSEVFSELCLNDRDVPWCPPGPGHGDNEENEIVNRMSPVTSPGQS